MTEMSPDQNERYVRALERVAESNDVIAAEFGRRGKIDDALVEKWRIDNELHAQDSALRQQEYERLDRWRVEDLERMAKQRDEEIERLFGRFQPKAEDK